MQDEKRPESETKPEWKDAPLADPIAEILARPSASSRHEMLQYRARFNEDRATQQMNDDENSRLLHFLSLVDVAENFDQWRVMLGKAAIRQMGIVEHVVAPYDWYLHHECPKLFRKMNPWVIASHNQTKVNVFKIAQVYLLPPTQLTDEDQRAQMTPHEARLANLPYEASVVVDVAHWVLSSPSGLTMPSASSSSLDGKERKANGKPTASQAKQNRFRLPEGWQKWNIESRHLYLRQPYHNLSLLTMSWLDRRSSGLLPQHAFAQDDRFDDGGYYATAGNAVHMPACETLAHNRMFSFPVVPSNSSGNSQPTSIAMESGLEDEGYETPNLDDSFSSREAKALIGLQLHAHRLHRIEIRCCHPSLRQRSTSTITVFLSKQAKKQTNKPSSVVSVKMQFLSSPIPSTVIFLALGFSLDEATELMRSIAGPHWYGKAFDVILRKMALAHPAHVKTQRDACLEIVNHSDKEKLPEEKRIEHSRIFLQKQLFPQIGLSDAYHADKAMYLAHVHWTLFMSAVGYVRPDSKDHYVYQRYDTNGTMWASLQRQMSSKIYTKTDGNLRTALANQIKLNWMQIFNSIKMSEVQQSCVTRGIWATTKHLNGASRTGVTLALKTTCQPTINSSLRRCNTATKANRRTTKSKQICETMLGRLCCIETPEGDQCGNVRFLAVLSTFSLHMSSKVLLGLLRQWIAPSSWVAVADTARRMVAAGETIQGNGGNNLTKQQEQQQQEQKDFPYLLDLDGHLVWRCRSASEILNKLRAWRRSGLIGSHVGCGQDGRMIYVRTSPGRSLRLLFVLKPFLAWFQRMHASFVSPPETQRIPSAFPEPQVYDLPLTKAMSLGIVEWVDAMEERCLSIASSFDDIRERGTEERFSHMEIDPANMLGLTAQMLPYPCMNQLPRSVLGCAMMKQTFSGLINPYKVTSQAHILENGSKPLVQTRIHDDLQYTGATRGHRALAALTVGSHLIEDAQEMNQTAMQMGFLRTSLLRRFVTSCKPPTATRIERFEKPDRFCLGRQDANYDKLQADGAPRVGTAIEPDDILIAKTIEEIRPILDSAGHPLTSSSPSSRAEKKLRGSQGQSLPTQQQQQQQQLTTSIKTDDSLPVKEERGVVVSVKTVRSDYGGGHLLKEIVVHTTCLNEIGDKYFSTHGQKGTIGLNSIGADCWFSTVTGGTLWMKQSHLGMMSRMTHGNLEELYMGKVAAYTGEQRDATAFRSQRKKDREKEEAAKIFGALGCDKFGRERHINGLTGELTEPIFTGMIQICPLAHLVGNKIHARNRGPRKPGTRQADDGRSRMGGLRMGGMEIDCLISLGVSETTNDRLTKSDAFALPVCETCGLIAEANREKGRAYCRTCRTGSKVNISLIPYTNKLFLQEIMGMHLRAHVVVVRQDAGQNEIAASHGSDSAHVGVGANNWSIPRPLPRVPEDPDAEYLKDPKAPVIHDNYNKLRWEAKPMPWELDKYNIPRDLNLEEKQAMLSSKSTRESVGGLNKEKTVVHQQFASWNGVPSTPSAGRRRAGTIPQSPASLYAQQQQQQSQRNG